MILLVITKVIAILLGIYIARKVRNHHTGPPCSSYA